MFAKEFHRVALIAGNARAHPHNVHVFWHEHVGRTKESLASGAVQEQFAETQMEDLIQPTFRAAFERSGPEHNGESAIEFGRESRKMMPLRLRRERRRLHPGERGRGRMTLQE